MPYGRSLIGRKIGGPVRGAGPPVPSTALRATPTAMRSRVRASKVRARKGTGMQATLLPARRKTTSFWPNSRMLRMPLKILTFTRAGFVLTTSVRTHLDFFRERRETDPGATTVAGPRVIVWGLGMVFWRLGAGGTSPNRRIRGGVRVSRV